MPASHWLVRKVKGKRGAGAPFSLNRDQNSFHFHDLPSFERFSDSQTEQARTWSLYAAFCRLTRPLSLLGDSWEAPRFCSWSGATCCRGRGWYVTVYCRDPLVSLARSIAKARGPFQENLSLECLTDRVSPHQNIKWHIRSDCENTNVYFKIS